MAARTQLVPTQLVRDSFAVAEPAAVAAPAGGFYIQGVNVASPAATLDLRKVLLRFIIGTTATVVTLRASGSGLDVAGAAQVNPAPSNVVFTGATQGDLVSPSTTSATLDVGPLTTDRYLQVDASGNTYLYVDFSQVVTVTVVAYVQPFLLV
jgi:hypothetical protein